MINTYDPGWDLEFDWAPWARIQGHELTCGDMQSGLIRSREGWL